MRITVLIISIFVLCCCNHSEPSESPRQVVKDSSDKLLQKTDSLSSGDRVLIKTAEEILKLIKAGDYQKLAAYMHPVRGTRFSPYAFVDTINNKILLPGQFANLVSLNKAINWNSSWEETDKPELLTIDQYLKQFVYDADFVNAELKSINKFHSHGTDLNNINEIYPGCNTVEFFFSGFDKKYDGLDFRALRFVFKTENNKPYCVAIVHDQWTP